MLLQLKMLLGSTVKQTSDSDEMLLISEEASLPIQPRQRLGSPCVAAAVAPAVGFADAGVAGVPSVVILSPSAT